MESSDNYYLSRPNPSAVDAAIAALRERLYADYDELRRSQEAINAERDDEIHRLRDQVDAFTGTAPYPAIAAPNHTATPATVALSSFPDPPIFTGVRGELAGWLVQMAIKLSVNRDIYNTEQLRLAYAVARLGGLAFDQIYPYIHFDHDNPTANPIHLPDYASLVRILQDAFADPNPKRTAQDTLATLRQGNRECYLYAADFRPLAAATGYNDAALKHLFLEGLDQEMRTALAYHVDGDSGTCDEVMQRCIVLGGRLRSVALRLAS